MFNQIEADKLTIGQHIAHTANITAFTDSILMSIANEYIGVPDEEIHKLLKVLKLGFSDSTQIDILNYINRTNIIERCISKAVRITNGSAVCSLKLYKNPQGVAHEPFYVTDVLEYCNTFVVLDGLESMQSYVGKALVESVIDFIDVPILLQAGYLHYGDYVLENDENNPNIERLAEMYESLGFHRLNEKVGTYEDAISLMYSKKRFRSMVKKNLETKLVDHW